jgi:hypothetical protein
MDTSKLEKYDLIYPGHWISGSDRDWAFETFHLLSLAEAEFICAVASCSVFEPITMNNVESIRNKSKYSRSLNNACAKEFVYSLDAILKILKVLSKQPNIPDTVLNLISQYKASFCNLKHIRDSIAHIEDRGRALDKDKKGIASTLIILGTINKSRFEYTASDGNCYGVDISEATLLSAHTILQAIINAFNWE